MCVVAGVEPALGKFHLTYWFTHYRL